MFCQSYAIFIIGLVAYRFCYFELFFEFEQMRYTVLIGKFAFKMVAYINYPHWVSARVCLPFKKCRLSLLWRNWQNTSLSTQVPERDAADTLQYHLYLNLKIHRVQIIELLNYAAIACLFKIYEEEIVTLHRITRPELTKYRLYTLVEFILDLVFWAFISVTNQLTYQIKNYFGCILLKMIKVVRNWYGLIFVSFIQVWLISTFWIFIIKNYEVF